MEGGMALGLDEDRPSRSQPPQRIVEPAGDGDEFSRHRAIEIGTAKTRRALEAAILVEDNAFVDQRRPWQEIRETGRRAVIFGEVHHRAMSIEWASDAEMAGDAQMAAHHIDEHRIALRRPNRGGMADDPEQQACDPQAKAETQSRGQCPVQDRNGARRPAEQDRLGQRPVNGSDEAWNGLVRGQRRHQISAPPPKEKNDRKKLDAAKAIDRPKTI